MSASRFTVFLLFTIFYLERRARIPCIAGSRPRRTARMAPFYLLCTIHGLSGPLLFTLYYSLWKISRNLDFVHRGPPTLNVGQQIYCFFLLFTIYYLERRARFFLHRGQPTQKNGQNGPLLFTLYYSLWKISRNRDFLHRGPPTLNVGQQIYCFPFYYFLFRTESENSLHRGQPTQKNGQNGPLLFTLYYSRPEWPPSIYSVLFPMENFAKPGFFASRATNPECRPADLLFFFTIYYLLFRTESENSLHRGQPTQKNGQNGTPSVYSVLFPMENFAKPGFCASRATNPECRPADLLFFLLFTIYYLERRARFFLHRGQPTQKNGQNGPLLFTVLFPMENLPTR